LGDLLIPIMEATRGELFVVFAAFVTLYETINGMPAHRFAP
jgi:hypothetical protein